MTLRAWNECQGSRIPRLLLIICICWNLCAGVTGADDQAHQQLGHSSNSAGQQHVAAGTPPFGTQQLHSIHRKPHQSSLDGNYVRLSAPLLQPPASTPEAAAVAAAASLHHQPTRRLGEAATALAVPVTASAVTSASSQQQLSVKQQHQLYHCLNTAVKPTTECDAETCIKEIGNALITLWQSLGSHSVGGDSVWRDVSKSSMCQSCTMSANGTALPSYCCWPGVYCCREDITDFLESRGDTDAHCRRGGSYTVLMLAMRQFNLSGSLADPWVLSSLEVLDRHTLHQLDLSSNSIQGSLTARFAGLGNLTHVNLNLNSESKE